MRHALSLFFAIAIASPASASDSPNRFLVRYEIAGKIIGLQADRIGVEMPVAKQGLSSGNSDVRSNTAQCITDYKSAAATSMQFFESAKTMNRPDQEEMATLFIEAAAHHLTQSVDGFIACLIRNKSFE